LQKWLNLLSCTSILNMDILDYHLLLRVSIFKSRWDDQGLMWWWLKPGIKLVLFLLQWACKAAHRYYCYYTTTTVQNVHLTWTSRPPCTCVVWLMDYIYYFSMIMYTVLTKQLYVANQVSMLQRMTKGLRVHNGN